MANEKLNTNGGDLLNTLFSTGTQTETVGGANQLSKTAKLTALSTTIANEIFATVTADAENFEGQLQASMKSHDAMDDLINDVKQLGEIDVDFLKEEDEDTLEKMIRSQQSKRSRSKSKEMTQANYMAMMVGAVAENLLRIAAGKPKGTGGGSGNGEVGYSEEDLAKLAEFPEELKKAIRNVQSKKSIMRAKQGFSEEDLRWQQLLATEAQLKELRDQQAGLVNEEAKKALETKSKVEEMLSAQDIENLPADEAKALLDAVREMLVSK